MNNNYQQFSQPYGYYLSNNVPNSVPPVGQLGSNQGQGQSNTSNASGASSGSTNANASGNTNTNASAGTGGATNGGATSGSGVAGNTSASSTSTGSNPGLVQSQVPGVQSGSASMPMQQPTTNDYYAAARYPYQPNYMYNQIPSQITQPQPQHYNYSANSSTTNANGPISVVAPPISGNGIASNPNQPVSNATPIQDTLNSSATSSVGQYQPPGVRPRVTTTMWEDEKTLCYQVDANNVSVVRRADNNMINGTKLLNVARMTRGRRDGILKSEKVRHVVKIGSMHLKGVWIPFERALAMAQREGIVDLLYPLFVRDIKRVIQTGVTPAAAGATAGVAGATAATGAATATGANANGTAGKTSGTPPTYQNYQPDYSQYNGQTSQTPQQQGGVSTAVANGDPKLQQIYGYQQPLQPPQQQYYNNAAQQYPYYNQYNQYSGQMYQGYGYQVPPTLHQQPAPAVGSTEQSDAKKEEK